MSKFNAYFNFPGNAEEAFNHYKSVFGGELSIVRFKDLPMPGTSVSKEDETKMLHIALRLGNGDALMASDALASMGQQLVQGNNVYTSVQASTKEEADRIFGGLSSGGAIEMSMADQPWGDYYGSCKDRFGMYWMVSYSYPKTETGQAGQPMAETMSR